VARTDPDKVKGILGKDYDTVSCPSLAGYITAANLLTTRVATCASSKGTPLSTAELESIERWLAAWFYTKSDPVYASKSTGKSSGSFVRGAKEPEPYKDAALALDPSGCLSALLNRQTAGGFWAGKPVSEWLTAEERG